MANRDNIKQIREKLLRIDSLRNVTGMAAEHLATEHPEYYDLYEAITDLGERLTVVIGELEKLEA